MAERPPPESIRGSWYFLPDSANPLALGDKVPQIMRFRLDGTFSRYLARESEWQEKEKGDYTFDGQFLIIRGRNTDTYRVRCDAFWRWVLEGKKEEQVLLRALISRRDFVELDAEDLKEIRILPIRVGVEAPARADDAIYELVYRKNGVPRTVGSFFIEQDGARLWVGLSRFVKGVEDKTWERVIRDSYLDIFRSKPEDVRVVTVRMLDTDESRVFNY